MTGRSPVVAIVQARMGSSRLPGKVLADLAGDPLLLVLLRRLRAATRLDRVVVATTDDPTDDPLVAAVESWGFDAYRGPVSDVLRRYAEVARATGAGTVVRVTGDCPLIDPVLVDEVLATLLAHPEVGYVSLDGHFPDGADCEAFTADALETADREADLPSEREHVTVWIRSHPELVAAATVHAPRDDSAVRLTVDEAADLAVVRALVARLGASPDVSIAEYAEALQLDQDLAGARPGVTRNEGLWRSQNRDQLASIGVRHGRARSDELLARAEKVIPSGTQTLSKGADQFVRGVTPSFLQSGSGCHVTDVDGNVFIDYPMALGPVILGYNHPRTVEAVSRQIQEGSTFTLPHPLEVEVAELIVDAVPCAEMVRFAKNGSDATDGAVRLARAVTGRNVILASGYHGWHDWYVVQTPRNAGVPSVLRPFIHPFPFNDLAGLQALIDEHAGDLAAVILEVPFEDPAEGYLDEVNRRVHAAGGLVIYDEIVTGFRFALGGAQERYGTSPDLACLGKAMANGMPLAAVVGRKEIMEGFDKVFFSGTFGGETLSLAACKATIEEIRASPVTDYIWREGERLHTGVRLAIQASGLEVDLIGQPPRGALVFNQAGEAAPALRGLFLQETVRRGVLFGGPIFTTYAHDPADVDRTVEICGEVFDILRQAVESDTIEKQMEGPPPGVVFRLVRS